MVKNSILGSILASSFLCYGWGVYSIYVDSDPYLLGAYLSTWYALQIMSSITGLLSIYLYYTEEDESIDLSHTMLHRHYLLSWLGFILGYPIIVTYITLNYFNSPYVNILATLGLIPFTLWFTEYGGTSMATKCVLTTSVVIHMVVSLLTKNWIGLISAVVSGLNIISIATPTSLAYFQISPHETFLTGISIVSAIFPMAAYKS